MVMPARQDVHDSLTTERVRRRVVVVCDAVGDFIAYWGFKAVHGRVWALLALANRPFAQAEVARTLGVSRSLISGSIAELMQLGLVRPVGESRQAPYEAVLDVWPTISEVLRSREWMLIETARQALEGALEATAQAEELGETVDFDTERMRTVLGMTEVAQSFVRLLIRMRGVPATENFTGWLSKAASAVGRWRSRA